MGEEATLLLLLFVDVEGIMSTGVLKARVSQPRDNIVDNRYVGV